MILKILTMFKVARVDNKILDSMDFIIKSPKNIQIMMKSCNRFCKKW